MRSSVHKASTIKLLCQAHWIPALRLVMPSLLCTSLAVCSSPSQERVVVAESASDDDMTWFRRHCPLSMQLQALHDILMLTTTPLAPSHLLISGTGCCVLPRAQLDIMVLIESMSTPLCHQDVGPLDVSGTPVGHHGCVHAGTPP